jgi:hypothetical protein
MFLILRIFSKLALGPRAIEKVASTNQIARFVFFPFFLEIFPFFCYLRNKHDLEK